MRRASAVLATRGALPDGRRSRGLPLRLDLVAVEPGRPGGFGYATTGALGRPAGRGPVVDSAGLSAVRGQPPSPRPRRRAHTRCRHRTRAVPGSRARGSRCPVRVGARGGSNRTGGPRVPTVSMRQLLEAGVHFGHQTRRWNPKMRPFIFAERNGIHIIDLAQTVQRLDVALDAVRETTGSRRERPLRRHQEAGPGAGHPGGRSRRPAVRQPALAGRHAHQLRHDQEAPRPARAARGAPRERRLRPDAEEGSRPPTWRSSASSA